MGQVSNQDNHKLQNYSEFRTHIQKFWASKQDSFGKVGQDWASLGKFGQIWASVGKYGQVKASMGKYGQVWASMNIHINNFGQISKKQVITTKLQQFRRAN